MKITQRLQTLIEEQDCDEGDAITAILLEPDVTREEVVELLFEFMMITPGFSDDPAEHWRIQRYIDANLLANDEDDLSADSDEVMAVINDDETDDADEEDDLDDDNDG